MPSPEDDPNERTSTRSGSPGPGPSLTERDSLTRAPVFPSGPAASAAFPATPEGARSARRYAVAHLAAEGFPSSSEISGTVALLVGELAANAARHGRVPGHVPDRAPSRGFRLRLAVAPDRGGVRIEVTDASPALPPPVPRL
ncbi:hypothetical protein FNX48_018025, partial [Streptomyces sp. IF17]